LRLETPMKKNYVLDTNILLHDPQSVFRFEDNNVIIPIYAIEEVDQFKREGSERGRNARQIARILDGLREQGSLSKGVTLEERRLAPRGGAPEAPEPRQRPIDTDAMDAAILQTAFDVREEPPQGRPTVFVTMDTNLRIRADALGMVSETYENQRVEAEKLDTGVAGAHGAFGPRRRVLPRRVPRAPARESLLPNSCVLLRDAENASHTAIGRYDAQKGGVIALRVPREGVMGVRPRNKEQSLALDLLLDESIRLVTLVGKAGTGKTLLAIAAGLKRTIEDGIYTRILVSRPVMPLGRDIGFLPGDVDEKLNPWMQPIFDNLEFLFSTTGRRRGSRAYAGAARERSAPGRAAHLHPRSVSPAAVHHRRRGPEPHASRGEDHHHALGRRHEDRPHRGPGPDRQSLRRQRHQRPLRRGRQASRARRSPATSS
jgi:PhoH-like ATPase